MNVLPHDPPYGSGNAVSATRQLPDIVPVRGPFCESWTAGPGPRHGLRAAGPTVPGRCAGTGGRNGRRTVDLTAGFGPARCHDVGSGRSPVHDRAPDSVSYSVLDAVCDGVCDDIPDASSHRIRDDACGSSAGDLPGFWRRTDPGSGTVLGVALIAVTALLMAALAMAGNVVLCRAQARTAADLGAIAAATAWTDGSDDVAACSLAADAVTANGASLASCVIDGEDAQVVAGVTTQVPIAPQVTYESRAGPVDCGP